MWERWKKRESLQQMAQLFCRVDQRATGLLRLYWERILRLSHRINAPTTGSFSYNSPAASQ